MKLAKIGVTGNFLDTQKQLYTDYQATVDVNCSYTDLFYISSGVNFIFLHFLQYLLMFFVMA